MFSSEGRAGIMETPQAEARCVDSSQQAQRLY